MMIKDFDKWNELKKKINSPQVLPKRYHERDIWWCSLGANVGHEHDGIGITYQRPMLILKGLGADTCLAIPITSSSNRHRFRIPIGVIYSKNASAVISQIRVIDTKRLVEKMCRLDTILFNQVRKSLKEIL